jgi:hypothetical protein
MGKIVDKFGRAIGQNQDATNEHNGVNPADPTAKIPQPAPHQETAPNEENRTIDQRRFQVERRTFYVICAGLVVAIVGGLIYYFQWQAAEKQANEMQAQRMMDERAWIQFDKPRVEWKSPTNGTFIIALKNSGKTPAFVIATLFHIDVCQSPNWTTNESVIATNMTALTILAPGQERPYPLAFNALGTNSAASLVSDTVRLRFVFDVEYTNVFGHRCRSLECFEYAPGNLAMPSNIIQTIGLPVIK